MGPGDEPLTIDVDSTLCETYGNHKQGARDLTYVGEKGYHPLITSIGGSGEILHARLREGRAFTGRGAARFVAEAISRARHAGARGPVTVRADAGFYSNEFTSACRRSGANFLSDRPLASAERSLALPESRASATGSPYPITKELTRPRTPTPRSYSRGTVRRFV